MFVKLDFSSELKQKNIVGDFRLILHSVQAEMENDVAIRNLISAFLLFKPRPGISCLEFVK